MTPCVQGNIPDTRTVLAPQESEAAVPPGGRDLVVGEPDVFSTSAVLGHRLGGL